MSVDLYEKALVSTNNDLYQKHKKVLIACINAGVKELPKETEFFFGSINPCEYLLENNIELSFSYLTGDYKMTSNYDKDIIDGLIMDTYQVLLLATKHLHESIYEEIDNSGMKHDEKSRKYYAELAYQETYSALKAIIKWKRHL